MRALALSLATWLVAASLCLADGERLSPTDRGRGGGTPLYSLCTDKVAADQGTDCSDLRVSVIPSAYIFEVSSSTNCSAYSIAVKGKITSTGNEITIGTLSNTGSARLIVSSPLPEYLLATLTTLTACTDLDVQLEVLTVRNGL